MFETIFTKQSTELEQVRYVALLAWYLRNEPNGYHTDNVLKYALFLALELGDY